MKQCIDCKIDKGFENFFKKISNKDGYSVRCKPCHKVKYGDFKNRLTPAQNKTRNARNYQGMRKRAERNLKWVIEYFKTHPCIDCGESNPIVLEFDHKSNKKYRVSVLIGGGKSLDLLKNEIKKCEVRCANCHRIKTAYQFNYKVVDLIK